MKQIKNKKRAKKFCEIYTKKREDGELTDNGRYYKIKEITYWKKILSPWGIYAPCGLRITICKEYFPERLRRKEERDEQGKEKNGKEKGKKASLGDSVVCADPDDGVSVIGSGSRQRRKFRGGGVISFRMQLRL